MIWSRRKREHSDSLEGRDLGAFFGKDTQFEGVLKFEGTLRIDGLFKGAIEAGGTLIVGADGNVQSDVSVSDIVIYGEVRGNIVADKKIEIDSSGKVFGDIQAPSIVIRDGAILDGKCRMEARTISIASVVPIDSVSQEEGISLRLGASSPEMRKMEEEDVHLASLQLLIIMCLAYLKDYPVGKFRKDAIIANANHVAKCSGGLRIGTEGVQGDKDQKSGMDRAYVFHQRVRLLALMAKGFAEGNPMGRFRKKALEENVEFIGNAINFIGKLHNVRFLKVA